jgi:hypothetical protein
MFMNVENHQFFAKPPEGFLKRENTVSLSSSSQQEAFGLLMPFSLFLKKLKSSHKS